jgi:hypothetical protein
MPEITQEEYLEMVSKIPDLKVKDEIEASDVNYGVGNEASLLILNDYLAGELPSQKRQREEEERGGPPDIAPQPHLVLPPFGATDGDVDNAYSKAFIAKRDAYYRRHYKPTEDMTLEEKQAHSAEINRKARTDGIRNVLIWYNARMTSEGRPMAMADSEKEKIEAILNAQGLGSLWEAMKPRVYSKASLVQAMVNEAEQSPEDVEAARKLLREFYWDDEMEAVYMAVRPQMKAKAQSVVREESAFQAIVDNYMESEGFELVVPFTNRWKKTQSFEIPATSYAGYGGGHVAPARTETMEVEVDTPRNWEEYLELVTANIDPDVAAEQKKLAELRETDPEAARKYEAKIRAARARNELLARRNRAFRSKRTSGVDIGGRDRRTRETREEIENFPTQRSILQGIRLAHDAAVDAEEGRMVAQARQEESLAFYTEAIELVTDRARERGLELPAAGPGRPGTEQRAVWDALPQELRDNWGNVRTLANKLARKKAEMWDLMVYPDYREKEMGLDREDFRIRRYKIPLTDIGFDVQYDADAFQTRLFENANDLLWSTHSRRISPVEVAETPLMTTVRNLGGAIRWVTSPIMGAFSYDVDEDGNPIDPSDWNYRFSQWLDNQLIKTKGGTAGAWEQISTGLAFGLASFIPTTMEKKVGPTRMSTGNFVKDIAIQTYNGHFLGHDFMELTASRRMWSSLGMPNAPMYFGLGAEVAMPVTPYFAVKGISQFAGRTLQGADGAFKTGKLSDFIEAFSPLRAELVIGSGPRVGPVGKVGRWMENPLLEAQTTVLASIGRNVTRVARGVDNIEDVADLIANDARVPRQLAVRLTEEILNNLDFSSLETLRKTIQAMRLKEWGKNSGIQEVLEDLLVAAGRLDKAKKTNTLKHLKGDRQGLSLIDEIGAQAAAGRSVPFSADFNKGVMMGYVTEKMTRELINYIPNRYVMATQDVIVPLSTWKRSRNRIESEVARKLKTEVVNDKYKYTDSAAAADLMNDAFGRAQIVNTPYLNKIYNKLRTGKLLEADEFLTIDNFLRGSIVKSVVKDSYRLKVAGSAWERAKAARTGRQRSLPRMVQDFYRGLNPVARIDAMLAGRPTAPPAKILLSKKAAAVEGMPLETLKFWRSTSEELVQIDRLLREEVLKARSETGDAWDGLTLVLQSYSSGNYVDDIMEILFGKPGQAGGFFGERAALISWDAAKREIKKHLKRRTREHGSGMFDALTPGAIVDTIDFLRSHDLFKEILLKKGTQPVGMGTRIGLFASMWKNLRYKRMPANPSVAERAAILDHNRKLDLKAAAKTDYADASVWAWMVNAKKQQIIQAKAAEFAKVYPQLVIPVGKTTYAQRLEFDVAIRESLGAAGLPPGKISTVVKDISDAASRVFFVGWASGRGLNAADMRFIMGKIIEDLYEHGAGNFLTQQRLADAIVKRLGAEGEAGIETLTARIPELKRQVKRILEDARLGRGTRRTAVLATKTPDELNELVSLIVGRAVTDMIEATTKQTIDTLMGNLSSAGFGARLDDTGVLLTDLKVSLVKISDEYSILMPRMKEVVDPQDIMLLEETLKQNANGMLEANLDKLRARDHDIYRFYLSRFGIFFDWTKRGTIGGLLGGFGPFGVFRFHGVNVLTAPLIMTVTAPRMVLTAVKAMPKAGASLLKPVTEAAYPAMTKAQKSMVKNIPYTDTFFNWMGNRFSKDPNKILFVDRWGSPWTRARFEAAVNSANIRFSQVSFEFRESVLHELRRAAATKPSLQRAGYMRQILRWFDPFNKSIWTRFAEEADMAYREAVFAAGLKEGMPVAEASTLARNALLDYGSIHKSERRVIANYMLFYAFRRKMLQETLEVFLRNGDSMRLLVAQARFVEQQHKISDSWIRESDWQRTRLWSKFASEFDGVQNFIYGVGSPPLEAFASLVNIGYGVMDYTVLDSGPATFNAPKDLIMAGEEGWLAHPLWGLFRDMKSIYYTDKGYQPLLRAEWVYAFQEAGLWNTAVNMFDIVPVDRDDRRSNEYLQLKDPDGRPVYSQYKISGQRGRTMWKAFYRSSEMLGFNRAIRDWSMTGIRSGEDDNMVWKKHVTNSAWGHLFGWSTPGEVPGWVTIRYNQNRAKVRALNKMKDEN